MATITPVNSFQVDLTEKGLRSSGAQPLEVGNDWRPRIKVSDEDGAAIDLTGASIIMAIRLYESASTSLERDSVTEITGSGGLVQIEIDDDQVTNTGYFTLNFTRFDEDVDALTPYAGRARPFQIRLKVADGTYKTVAKGIIDILLPIAGSPP